MVDGKHWKITSHAVISCRSVEKSWFLCSCPRRFALRNHLHCSDSFTFQNILSGLKRVTKDRTSIFIAHRLSTVVDADEILVLEEGRVRERGSHLSLITDSNSLYAHLWHKQHEAHKVELHRTDISGGTTVSGM